MSDSQELAATSTVEELSVQMERLREELQRRDRELEELRTVASRATRELELVRKPLEDRVVHLERDLEQAEMKGELTMLRALESLRAEHQQSLRKETERAELWIEEIKKSHATERTQLLERISVLEKVSEHAVTTREHNVTHGEGLGSRPITPEGHDPSETAFEITSAADSPRSPSRSETVSEPPHVSTVPSSLSATATPFKPSITAIALTTSGLTSVVTPSHVSPLSSTTVVPPGVTTSSTSTTLSDGVGAIGASAGTSSTDLVSTMARLLQAQTDAMAAQAKAVAMQNLPSLPCFTGEGSDAMGDGYDKWVQRFREG